jgi:mRNA interferase RelE/StbE
MNVILSRQALKYLERMNEPLKGRIKSALKKLEQDPPQGSIRPLVGKDGYRLRVGNYRLLLDITTDSIVVYEIGPRGQIYKGGA